MRGGPDSNIDTACPPRRVLPPIRRMPYSTLPHEPLAFGEGGSIGRFEPDREGWLGGLLVFNLGL
jgi:hypothetical protein